MYGKITATGKIAWYTLVIMVIVPFIFPLIWIFTTSFKMQNLIVASPPVWLFRPTLVHYQKVFIENDFLRYMLNSAIIAVASTLLSLIIGLPAAYSIARYSQKKFGMVILVARLMPGISFLIPWFIIFKKLNLIDTFFALISSHMVISLPLIVWIMINYFGGIPRELEQAAVVDGCTLQGVFMKVVLPLSGPGILTAVTLSFIYSWNNFMFSNILSNQKTKTLPIAIFNFVSYAEIDWGSVMAAAIIIIAPAIMLTMFFQKYVIKGLTMGAVKG